MEVLSAGNDRFRVGSWRGDPAVGYLMPLTRIGPGALDTALRSMHSEGYRRVVTGALGHDEQGPFLRQGFVVHERLHLLKHDLRTIPFAKRDVRIRRGWRRDRQAAINIDNRAFDDFWRFDKASFTEAVEATPISRFRVASAFSPDRPADRTRICGYSVAGRAGRTGYLQRLAVDPSVQGRGVGTALIVDTLEWLDRRGSVAALVNTQETNVGAYELYLRLGFEPIKPGLAVLEIML